MGTKTRKEMEVGESLSSLSTKVNTLENDKYSLNRFYFSGNNSETTYKLIGGDKPFLVYVDGSLFREGASEDYTVKYDGFNHSVVFAVAPAVVNIDIVSKG